MKASRLATTALIALGSTCFGSAPGCSRDQLVAVSEGTPGTSGGTSSSAGGSSAMSVSATGGSTTGGTRTSASSVGGAYASTTAQTGGSAQTATGGSSSSSTGCAMNDLACRSNDECCSGNCSRSGLCAPPQSCRTRGQPCESSSECCSRQCRDRYCEPVQDFCRIIGEECSSHGECCSNTCADPGNGIKTCQGLEGCRPLGELCVNGGPEGGCCSEACESRTSITGDPGFCSPGRFDPGRDSCLPPGEVCDGVPLACCVRNPDGAPSEPAQCAQGWTGVARCDSGGCFTSGSPCTLAEDCCSGNCSLSANSSGGLKLSCLSGDGTDCGKPGSACRASRDCCVGSACFPRGRDDDLRSINGICKLTGYSCRQLGQPCGPGEACCDGLCQGSPGLCVPVRL